ncbi:MAG: ISL3 family transposase [Pseudodesulfovibrio sp.]|uniref:Transposase IS204/IS1001/IS1096/IS1165 family protein n=1 Tax=Pseudodesulfovibrio aespoeensis (strain ATCC 700646 / DSM 10631 / Aspo-2) TaxID=643562 RepID=E6VX05_PSEA9|nr:MULTISPECIES: ISL3 family transposase [Pseudodesulfovibrio]MBU4245371.1 ISL3 family transposase [Pseudomonadota bacterium]ADU61411.1 transposase IS204/IS1001/IS1096/IS1165 family protein [Pseudodesulfovibrio aespoeensis Aspo-2]MBU4379987.1 ISL3 family transposase [Pseudomonadota bacterium]MBU4474804.1 ISL3 family transposase [Pseudomonadota bacterium]MBU4516326.1 ISL3 family transposase [Pseudomonadota bacterium]
MSTSLMYHAFGLTGFDYVRQSFVAGNIIFDVRPKPKLVRCPECKSQEVVRRGSFERWLRTVPIGFKPVWLCVEAPRVECRKCGCVRRIDLKIAEPRRWYTRAFERFALALTKMMTMLDASALLGIGWDGIKSIFKRHLQRRFGNPSLSGLKYIAIDEISVRKGHKYLTLVMDLESGAIVFVGDGKGAEALDPFWKRLKRSSAMVQAVATDLSIAYISAVMTHLPGVPLVFDHFHVVKLMNDKLTEIRRKIFQELENMPGREVLKGSRWILLKNPENLNKKRNEPERLKEALRFNEPLATAYYMKEDLRQIWSQSDKAKAFVFLDDWIARATTSGIGPLVKMGNTMVKFRFGILAWYDHPISSSPMEGSNNKIKTMKRQAYGYRDKEFFKLRIMGIHESRFILTG